MSDETEDEEDEEAANTADPRFYLIRNAAYADLEEAERLVREDPSIIHARNGIGETPFHFLVVEDDMESVRWLLEHGSDVNTRNDSGGTPLSDAASLGYLEMCRFLLEHGANPRIRNQYGETALSEASTGRRSNPEVVKLLLDQLKEDEDVNDYFGEYAVSIHLDKTSPSAELLRERGLIIPNEED